MENVNVNGEWDINQHKTFLEVVILMGWNYRRHIKFPPLGNRFSLRTRSSLFNLEFSSCNSWIYCSAFVRISDLFCCCCSVYSG